MRLLLAILVNIWLLVRFPLLALRRARAAPAGAWLTVEIDGAVVEIGRAGSWWDRRPRPVSIYALREVTALAKDDPRVRGVFVKIGRLRAGGAIATSLRQALLEVKTAGKQLVVYLPDGAGTREMFVASAADRIILGPQTEISALGYAVEVQHIKETLEKVGVEPDVFARGRYKTAAEFLSSTTMSEPQREQLEALLDSSFDALVTALAEGRHRDEPVVRAWIDEGPWGAEEAVAQGLVDDVAYEDEVPRKLDSSRKKGALMLPAALYRARRRIRWRPLRARPVIAVVQVHGAIVSRDEDRMLPVADAESICATLDAVRESRRVAGVIVHVDSRGGSALASDRILHSIQRVAADKPVIACMGDVAASGGYMAAVGAESIVAQPTTITGSIGVIAARFVVERLLRKVGVSTSVVKRGARSDMMSAARHLDQGERESLERHLESTYQSFLAAVAKGRKRTTDEIEPLAGGRVWSGRDAAERKLVDELGGFDLALARMRTRLGPRGERMEPVVAGGRPMRDLLSMLPVPIRMASTWLVKAGVPEVALLAASDRRERAWAWCEVGEGEGG